MPNTKRSSVVGKDDLIPFSMHEVHSIITLATTKKNAKHTTTSAVSHDLALIAPEYKHYKRRR